MAERSEQSQCRRSSRLTPRGSRLASPRDVEMEQPEPAEDPAAEAPAVGAQAESVSEYFSEDSDDSEEDSFDSDEEIIEGFRLASGSSDEEEEEEEEDDDDDDDDDRADTLTNRTVQQYFLQLHGGISGRRNSASTALSRFGPIPVDPPFMCNDLSQEVIRATAAATSDFQKPPIEAHARTQQRKNGIVNTAQMLWRRQANLYRSFGGFSPSQCCHMTARHYVPNRPLLLRDSMQSRAYIGQYSHHGNLYIGAFQADKRVRIYNTENNWQLVKDVHARNLRWTITDTCLSKDQALLLYATINPIVHLVSVNKGGVESEANVTEIHEALHLDEMADGVAQRSGHFGIFSVAWGSSGKEIAAGTGESSVLLYDIEAAKTTRRLAGHRDDVNAVVFLDESSDVIASGSDDHLIKIWDRRSSRNDGKAAGVLVGHTQGITHMDSKGDGRYLLSNSKDQTAKVWDVRKMIADQKFRRLPDPKLPDFGWDYRWMPYPGREYNILHPHDASVQTLRGHFVATTLIRAYWSPAHTTGQRYVYSASADAAVYIYDTVTSKLVQRLSYHHSDAGKEIIRDVSWHPYEPSIVSAGFDGALVEWGYSTESLKHHLDNLPDTGYDNLDDRW